MNSNLPSMAPIYSPAFGKNEIWDIYNYLNKVNIQKEEFNKITKNFLESRFEIRDYPFESCFGYLNELKQLSNILGVGGSNGQSILVTGYRGVGKTSFVNQAIYNIDLLGRGLIGYGKKDFNEELKFEKELKKNKNLKSYERIENFYEALNKGYFPLEIKNDDNTKTLILEVRINVANPITIEQLMKRVVRQFYLSLVESGIVGLAPELVKSARWAYIRSFGEIKSEEIMSLKESINSKFGVKIDSALEVKLGIEARKEIELAQKITTILPSSGLEENEDELIRLMNLLDGTKFNTNTNMTEKLSNIAKWIKTKIKNVSNSVIGTPSIETSVIFIFDELDKLVIGQENVFMNCDTESRVKDCLNKKEKNRKNNEKEVEQEQNRHKKVHKFINYQVSDFNENFSQRYAKAVSDVVFGLKQILTTGRANFIFISDERTAIEWQNERSRGLDNLLLRTIFSDHIHLSPLTHSDIIKILDYYLNKSKNDLVIKAFDEFKRIMKEDYNLKENINYNILNLIAYYIFYQSNGVSKNIISSLREVINKINHPDKGKDYIEKVLEYGEYGHYINNLYNSDEVKLIFKKYEIYKSQLYKILKEILEVSDEKSGLLKIINSDDREKVIKDILNSEENITHILSNNEKSNLINKIDDTIILIKTIYDDLQSEHKKEYMENLNILK